MKLTNNQMIYYQSIRNRNMTICNGPAGTGKTYISCTYAAEQLAYGKVNKIVLTRPTVSIGESLGYLPGSVDDKMDPFIAPMMDVFKEYFSVEQVREYRYQEKIEIVPLQFTQGRTFKNSIVIADEMQNSTFDQMYMLITRLGHNSKMIIIGDVKQEVSDCLRSNGLRDFINKLKIKNPDPQQMKVVQLKVEDVKRHPLVAKLTSL